MDSFNHLLKPNDANKANKIDREPKVLRCFISLENSYKRLMVHHGKLLSEPMDNALLVVIDASSLLSGRLEDRLRYAPLGQEDRTEGDSRPCHELHLAPCGSQDDTTNRCLFWQDDGGRSIPWEQAAQDPKKLSLMKRDNTAEQENNGESRAITLSLLSPPVADPGERVRLLKDLLAALFLRFRQYDLRLLALDSLSALLHSFEDKESEAAPSRRRLSMLNLVRWLEEQEVTTFMACEARRTEQNTLRGHPLFLGTEERYLASGVIQLDYHRYRSGDLVRYLRILKMRGAAHDMRPHAYDLSERGITWLEPLFGEAQQGGFHE